MKYRIVGIIIIILGLAIFGGVAYFMFFRDTNVNDVIEKITGDNEGVDDNNLPVENDQATGNIKKKIIIPTPSGNIDTTPTENNDSEFGKEDIERMALSFAERFGSYSNQSNFNNISDLKIFMSARMKTWADNYIREKRSQSQDNTIYYGITTRAIAKELLEFDEDVGRAVVKVVTRRREASGATGNYSDAFTQEVIVNLVKENGAWKVDSANWIE